MYVGSDVVCGSSDINGFIMCTYNMNISQIIFIIALLCCMMCSCSLLFGQWIPGLGIYIKPTTDAMGYRGLGSWFCMVCIWLFVLGWFFVLRPFGMMATKAVFL